MASEIVPQHDISTPDAGTDIGNSEPTAPQVTNGHARTGLTPRDESSSEAIVRSPSNIERSQDVSASRKRDPHEPNSNEEPGSKRVKPSEISSAGGNLEPTPETQPESIACPDSFNKETWQGFCEIESEPAYFSTILRDMGVRGVNVREVFAMEPWFFEQLPAPIYGLILLYRYREQGSSEPPTESSGRVWFANQLPAQNSCATLAMINIIMNSSDVEIGEHLQQFKDFTKDLTPYQRGEALASFDFVKKIHNSFAKKMDMLEADRHLSYKVKKSQRLLKDKKARRKSTDSVATNDSAEGYDDNAHHFIAYIPLGNEVWMLDGLNAQPTGIATFDTDRGESWLSVAADSILSIMAGEDHEFTSFAITQSPLLSLRKQACLAINTIKHVEWRLDMVAADWRSSTMDEPSRPHPQMLGVEDQLSKHPVPDTLAVTIAGEGTSDLLERRTRLVQDLDQLAASIVSEIQTEAEEIQKATQRRYDHGPVIKMWAEMLACNGWLEENLDRFMPPTGRDKKSKR